MRLAPLWSWYWSYLELYALSFELPYPQGSCRTAKARSCQGDEQLRSSKFKAQSSIKVPGLKLQSRLTPKGVIIPGNCASFPLSWGIGPGWASVSSNLISGGEKSASCRRRPKSALLDATTERQ